MMKISAIIALFPLFASAFSGSTATEAKLKFQHFVDVPAEKYTAAGAQEKVEEQIEHTFGPMTFRPENDPARGADRGDGTPEILRTEEIYDTKKGDLVRIHYTYETIATIGNGPEGFYNLALPRMPEDAYAKTTASKKITCTDDHYDSYGDFWYFWSPWRENCGGTVLFEGEDYDIVAAEIVRIPNITKVEILDDGTKQITSSYPEYERLPNRGRMIVYLLMGMDEPDKNPNPLEKENQDLNAVNFVKIRNEILKIGYPTDGTRKEKEQARKDAYKTFQPRKWKASEINEVVQERTTPHPYVESFVKKFRNSDRAQEMEVIMFFGKSGIDQGSKAFHWFLKRALSHGSIIIYDGHSGLGGHLNLRDIERKRTDSWGRRFEFYVPKERYQILYFNSCSSYTYYNKMFFNRKKTADLPGTKNLDIVATGLETDFEGGVETNMELITTVHNWVYNRRVKSYRTLLKNLENDNLSGVNGDEDNPKTVTTGE